MTALSLFVPLTKIDLKEGLVYGTAAAEETDRSGEILDYESSKPRFQAWSDEVRKASGGKSLGNVRAQHGRTAAGKLVDIRFDDAGKRVEVVAKIVDKGELEKLYEGIYTGFSVGGRYAKKWPDGEHTRYTADPEELSIVDRPCIKSATFEAIKSDGSSELRKFAEPGPELEQVWRVKDGTTFGKKAEALAHLETLSKTPAPVLDGAAKDLRAALDDLQATLTAPAPAAAAAPATLGKREFSGAQRKELAAKGFARADGSYPIEDKTDLENAMQAFWRSNDKKHVKAHLIKRAGELGAIDLLPDHWKTDGALSFGDLRKGLYAVSSLVSLIAQLDSIQQAQEYEENIEQDGSDLSSQLKASVATLVGILRAMVAEETAELFTDDEAAEHGEALEMSARPRGADALAKMLGDRAPAWLAKYGARHSASDKDHLDAAHDHLQKMAAGCGMAKAGARHSAEDLTHLNAAHDALVEAGAECGDMAKDQDAEARTEGATLQDEEAAGKSVDADEMAKALAAEQVRTSAFEKVATEAIEMARNTKTLIESQRAELFEQKARIEKLEAQPFPRPFERTARAVSKGSADPSEMSEQQAAAILSELSPEQRELLAIRYAPRIR